MSTVIELRQSEADRHEDVHEWLKRELELPETYGRNLDALWDCVTGYLPRPVEIRWVADSEEGGRYSAILDVFQEAAEEYDDVHFEYV
ncbi:barstar family protein [Cohnella sp.]|uniref:barstar family protein n=1 Tax=Cohnella sp. TaxID=1883426 RepID=UPI003569D938